MNLLAIDPGSIVCAVAYFVDDRPNATDRFRPKAGLPWAERLDYIAEQLELCSRTRGWIPDVVAVEDVALHSGARRNPGTLKTMSETRGYLLRVIRELFPRGRLMDLNPSTVRAAMSAPRSRAGAKTKFALVAAAMAPHLEAASEDERDALAIGWAALGKLREEALGRGRAMG